MNMRKAAVNIRFLLILVAIVVIVGGGAVGARLYQKRARAANALAAAEKAMAAEQWEDAYDNYLTYLRQNPDDEKILRKYVEAVMNTRPRLREHLGQAVTAYRRILRTSPDDPEILSKLYGVYRAVQNYSELAFVARKHADKSPEAMLALAWAKLGQEKIDEASEEVDDVLRQLDDVAPPNENKINAYVIAYQIARIQHPNDFELQRAPLEKALKFDADVFDPISLLAQSYREEAFEVGRTEGKRETDYKSLMEKARELLLTLKPENAMQDIIAGSEWLRHNELDRSQAAVDSARARAEPIRIPNGFPVTSDWLLAQYTLQARIALMGGELPETGTAFVKDAMEGFEGREYRYRAQPEAIQLYILEYDQARRDGEDERAARALADATDTNKKYHDNVAAMPVKPAAELVTFLDGLLAHAHGEYYEAISLLEPLVTSNQTSPPELFALLSDAFGKTGQIRRAVRAMEQVKAANGRLTQEMSDQLFSWYVELGDYASAVKETDNWDDVSKDDLERQTRIQWAKLELAQRLDRAEDRNRLLADVSTSLDELANRHADAEELTRLRSQLVAVRGNADDAAQVLQQRIAAAPSAELHYELADLYAAKNQQQAAIEELKQAVTLQPDHLQSWTRLGDLYTQAREFENAELAFNEGAQAASTPAEQREFELKLVSLDFIRGKDAAAFARAEKLLAKEGDTKRDIVTRVLMLSNLDVRDNRSRAEQLVSDIREIEGERGMMWRLWDAEIQLANRAAATERDKLIDSLQTVLAADPDNPQAIKLLGKAYEQKRDYRAAETLYQAAKERNPGNFEINYAYLGFLRSRGREGELVDELISNKSLPTEITTTSLVTSLVKAGQIDTAIERLEKFVAEEPDKLPSQILLAMLRYVKSEDSAAALATLDELEQDFGRSPEVARARAALLNELGRTDEAIAMINERIELTPDEYKLYEIRALLNLSAGEVDAARADFEKLPELAAAGNPDGVLRLGQFHLDTGAIDTTIELWKRGVRQYPDSHLVKRSLVKVLFLRNRGDDHERAAELIDRLESATDSVVDAELLMFRAQSMLERRESPIRARELLERAVELDPGLYEAELALIRLEMLNGNIAGAQRRTQEGIQRIMDGGMVAENPADRLQLSRLRTYAALLEEAAGEQAAAARSARLALELDPRSVDALEVLFRSTLAEDGPQALDDVLRRVDNALAAAPESQPLHILRAQIRGARGDVDRALADLNQYIEANPDNSALAYLQLADLKAMRGDKDGVATAINRAIELDPTSYQARNAQVVYLGQAGRYDDLSALVPKLIDQETQPTLFIVAAGNLVNSPTPQHRDAVRKLLDTAKSRFAPDDPMQLDVAKLYFQLGDLDQTIKLYQDFRSRNPDNVTALNDLAWFIGMEKGETDEAIKLADRGINLSPRHAELRDTRGHILFKRGDHEAAIVDFETAAQTAPRNALRVRALFMAARSADALGQADRARKLANDAIKYTNQQHDLNEKEMRQLRHLVGAES